MDFNGLERYINENLGDENPLAAAGRKEKKLLSLVDEVFNDYADLKMNLKATVENDKSDIEKAKELCRNMEKAAAEVFGHKSSDFQAEEKI